MAKAKTAKTVKPTPGEWVMEYPTRDGWDFYLQDEIGNDICRLDFSETYEPERAVANAERIDLAIRSYEWMLAALENLVERDLIKDKDNDHYDEVLDAIALAKGAK